VKKAVELVAELMAMSARTAPKAGGRDYIVTKIVTGDELETLARAMVKYGVETGRKNFDRDGANVRHSDAVLLLALQYPDPLGLNCGACGQATCSALQAHEGPEFVGPLCAWRLIDLGIAMGSAVKTASLFNVDNRIMYRLGAVARKMGLIDGLVVLGVPLSATGKNIYFDRS
jgi:uncharacterized ferredoxin-like protein